jgi:hypothetical protein
MNQTLRQMLGNVKKKVAVEKRTEEAKKDEKDKPKQPTFFERSLPGLRDGSTARNFELEKNVTRPRAKASIESIQSPIHPDHDKNVAEFFGRYGGDYDKINKAHLDAACDELQYPDVEDCKMNPSLRKAHSKSIQTQSGSQSRQAMPGHCVLAVPTKLEFRGSHRNRAIYTSFRKEKTVKTPFFKYSVFLTLFHHN